MKVILTGSELNKSTKKIRKIMKYDFTRCNNLQFKAKFNKGKEITGYLKVAKRDEEDVL